MFTQTISGTRIWSSHRNKCNLYNTEWKLLLRKFTSSKITKAASSSKPPKIEGFTAPPSYKDQVKAGVPFGRRKFHGRAGQTYLQVSVGLSVFIAFIATPFLGKKLATDEEFRKMVPTWYFDSYRMKIPENRPVNTRESLHAQLTAMQRDLHERAIRGEFTKENRDKMIFSGELKDDPYGWSKIHPGIDDDDDDDEEEDDDIRAVKR